MNYGLFFFLIEGHREMLTAYKELNISIFVLVLLVKKNRFSLPIEMHSGLCIINII